MAVARRGSKVKVADQGKVVDRANAVRPRSRAVFSSLSLVFAAAVA